MGNSRTFWKGILFGAIAGGAITLLDRETRHSVVEGVKKGTKEITYCVTHPTEMVEKIRDKTEALRSTVEQVSEDVSFIIEKVEELQEVTPAVAGIVNETKEAFKEE